jgi:CHASE2 domain-containing sensor protein
MRKDQQFTDDGRNPGLSAAIPAVIGLLLLLTPLGAPLVNLSYDLPFLLRTDRFADGVAIVQMDGESAASLQQGSPASWDTALHARFLEKLATWKVRAVVFVLPLEKSSTNDAALARAAAQCGRVIFAATVNPEADPRQRGGNVTPPPPELQRAAAWGVPSFDEREPEPRRYPDEISSAPTLALKAAQMVSPPVPELPGAARWVNFYGPPGALPWFRYADVLEDKLPSEVLSNHVIFVGPPDSFREAAGAYAPLRAPGTDGGHPGFSRAELEATAYLNLTRKEWLTRLAIGWEAILITVLGGAAGLVLGRFRPLRAALLTGAAVIAILASALALMWTRDVWFAWTIPALVQLPVALGWCAITGTWRLSQEMQAMEKALADAEPMSRPVAPAGIPENYQGETPPAVRIPNHRLLRCIGRGAYGEVWLAHDEIGVWRAVKILFRNNFQEAAPYEREYRGIMQYTPLSRTHHGLVQILHVGREGQAGYFYYVMELADCEHRGRNIDAATYRPRTLSHELDQRARLPLLESMGVVIELAEAVGYLHSRQLVHRDIKPANIIFVNSVPKLADVGLVAHVAEARRDDRKLGTQGFVPPEGPGSIGADVYSLGKVLCEIYLGRSVAESTSEAAIPADVSPERGQEELLEIIRHACAEDARHRYKAVKELQADLIQLRDRLGARP